MPGVMTFKEYAEIERIYFNPWFDAFYAMYGYDAKRVNKKGHDTLVYNAGSVFKFEEKMRLRYWPDLLIEDYQDMETNSKGWARYCDADYLLYGWANEFIPVKLYNLKWPIFRIWFFDNIKIFEEQISTKGWGRTLNRVVPIQNVPEEMVRLVFSGVE